jgi:hypothetical protein
MVSQAGCALLGTGSPHCPLRAIDPERLPADLSVHYRVAIDSGEGEVRTAIVAQREGDVLVVVGLTPFDTRAFSLRLEDGGLDLDRGIARHLGIEPLHVYDALARAALLDAQADSESSPDERSFALGDEVVSEKRTAGQLSLRRFAPASTSHEGGALVRWPADGAGALEVENTWCGYSARLLPLSTR